MPTQRKTYEEKVAEFNKLYAPLSFIDIVESNDGERCEVCGSHAPGAFYIYEDKDGKTHHAGRECSKLLITTWKGRCEYCHRLRIIEKGEVRLPNGRKVIVALCEECVSLWLKRPHPEGENKLYNSLMKEGKWLNIGAKNMVSLSSRKAT